MVKGLIMKLCFLIKNQGFSKETMSLEAGAICDVTVVVVVVMVAT